MNAVIHCRKRNGKTVFRLWNQSSDSYITPEVSEDELKYWLMKEEVREVMERVFLETPARIERARKKGTSSERDDDHKLDGPWEEENI
jgi:hypothetical protein